MNKGSESVTNCHRLKSEAAEGKEGGEPVTNCNRLKIESRGYCE